MFAYSIIQQMAPPLYSACQYQYANCSACVMDERCGWCSRDEANATSGLWAQNAGAGVCMEGAFSQANENRCKLNWYVVIDVKHVFDSITIT